MKRLIILILLFLTTNTAGMEKSPKSADDDSLLQNTIREMSIGLNTALTGIRMPGVFNPEKHLALITELIANGAPLNNPSHAKGTIFDTYWYEQKCNSPSCKEHTELFGKLLTALLMSEAGKATTRKEQRALYNALENKLEDLINHSPAIDKHGGKEAAVQLLKKRAQGLPMPLFKK